MGIFKFLRKNPSKDNRVSTEQDYLKTILPNGNTIQEQRNIDFEIAKGNFPKGTCTFCDMKIVPSVILAKQGYSDLNDAEQKFFMELAKQLKENAYEPSDIMLTRMADGSFNVDYLPICCVGKVSFYKKPDRYGVKKPGSKRLTKSFDSEVEANDFVESDSRYIVEKIVSPQTYYMQYMVDMDTISIITDEAFDVYTEAISKWIKYIDYCKRIG